MVSIDSVSIIIPLTRPTAYLEDILRLDSNKVKHIEFILVIDNPEKDFVKWVNDLVIKSKRKVTIIVNEVNIGAPRSRNKGMDNAKGDLLLFLDDDVIPEEKLIDYHIEELEKNNTFGVIGTTLMELKKKKKLHYAISKADFDYAFRLYQDYKEHTWGPTCNISYLREKIGGIRFNDSYPKKGGAEDVDFCWNIAKINNRQKMIVSDKAKVVHPPWQGIKSIYKRLKRWGYADPILFNNQPERKYLDWPNYPEINLILLIVTIIIGSIVNPWFFLLIPIHIVFSFLLGGIYQSIEMKCDIMTGQVIQSLKVWHYIGRLERIFITFKFHQLFYRTQYFDDNIPRKKRNKTIKEFFLTLTSFFITIISIALLIYFR